MVNINLSLKQIGWTLIIMVLAFGFGCTIWSPIGLVIALITSMLVLGIILVVTPKVRIER